MLRAYGSTDATVGGGKVRKPGGGRGNGNGKGGGGGTPSFTGTAFDPGNTDPGITLSNNNYTGTGNTGVTPASSYAMKLWGTGGGNRYFEFVVDRVGSNMRLGVGNFGSGITGTNGLSYGLQPDGTILQFDSSVGTVSGGFTTGDRIGIRCNGTNIFFSKNGGAETSVAYYNDIYPVWSITSGNSPAAKVTIHCSAEDILYLPGGATAWG